MRYVLNGDVSYCHVDDYLIFLNIRSDRYFRLHRPLENALLHYLESDSSSDLNISKLVEKNILVEPTTHSGQRLRAAIVLPTQSVFEQPRSKCALQPSCILGVFAAVLSTHLQLKTRSLNDTIDSLNAYRQGLLPASGRSDPDTDREWHLSDASKAFTSARLNVPIETTCLLDSLAMVKFLAKRGLNAQIVFGVTGVPFSAHCWVQAGCLALNDTIGNIAAHTPIRVV